MLKSNRPNIFISIIVPVYKVEKYLCQCVDSILEQTYKNFELILVDDGSPDGSPKICDEYATKDQRVTAIHQANGGQTKARKAGLAVAKGKYVFFVDSDDWLELNLLEIACASAVENDADIVTFDAFFNYSNRQTSVKQSVPSGCFDKDGLITHIYPKMIYSGNFFYFGIYAAMWNKIFRRSILKPNMINVDPQIKIGEDGVTTFATFLDAKKVCVLGGQHLYHYRDNNISITRSYCQDQFSSALLLINTLRDINKNKNVYDLSSQIDYYLMYNVYSIFREEFYYKFKKSFIARYKYLRNVAGHPSVQKACQNISIDNLQRKYRIFFNLLRKNRFNLLILVTICTAIRMRFKLQLKKALNRY